MNDGQPVIVVVEDNAADVLLLREALAHRRMDSEIVAIESGSEALDYLEGRKGQVSRPDLLLVDLNLPGVDGEALLRSLDGNEAMTGVPVIIWSSSYQRELRNGRLLELPQVRRFVTKPTSLAEFFTIADSIREVLEQSKGTAVS
jgi:CheY-like chemotaxis protein